MSAGEEADFELIIVGGGIVGCALAALLLRRGVCASGRLALITQRSDAPARVGEEWDLRVFALNRAAERVLRACDVWPALPPERVFAFERMRVWDARGEPHGRRCLAFDCANIGEPNLGYIVESAALQRACMQSARAAGASLIEAELKTLSTDEGAAHLGLGDGRRLSCRLLLAADGRDSKSRDLLGIATRGHAYRQCALIGHVRTAQAHQNTAWQRFLPSGPLAFLPLPDGRSSIVWSTDEAHAAKLRALGAQEFSAALTQASGGVLGRCDLSSVLAGFPLALKMAAEYVRPRVALVGDAAHVVHPLAGQGLNLGFMDCAVLAEELAAVAQPRELGDLKLLRRYERRRRADNLAAAAVLDQIEGLFSRTDPLSTTLRAAALGAANRFSALNGALARRALGLSGDIPAFLEERG